MMSRKENNRIALLLAAIFTVWNSVGLPVNVDTYFDVMLIIIISLAVYYVIIRTLCEITDFIVRRCD